MHLRADPLSGMVSTFVYGAETKLWMMTEKLCVVSSALTGVPVTGSMYILALPAVMAVSFSALGMPHFSPETLDMECLAPRGARASKAWLKMELGKARVDTEANWVFS